MYELTPMHTEKKRAWFCDNPEFYLALEIAGSDVSVFVRDRATGNESFKSTEQDAKIKAFNLRLIQALKNLADPAFVSKGGANMDKRFEEARELIKESKCFTDL